MNMHKRTDNTRNPSIFLFLSLFISTARSLIPSLVLRISILYDLCEGMCMSVYMFSIFNQISQINVCTSGSNSLPTFTFVILSHFFSLTFKLAANKRSGNNRFTIRARYHWLKYRLCPHAHNESCLVHEQ